MSTSTSLYVVSARKCEKVAFQCMVVTLGQLDFNVFNSFH